MLRTFTVPLLECFKEHLALTRVGRVQARVQGLLCPGQEQRKGPVIGAERHPRAGAHLPPRCVRGHDAQALPTLGFKAGGELFEQMCAQGIESPRGETASGLAEGAITELASATGLACQRGKQVVQLGLNAGAHSGEHHRQQTGKGERALAGKGGRG